MCFACMYKSTLGLQIKTILSYPILDLRITDKTKVRQGKVRCLTLPFVGLTSNLEVSLYINVKVDATQGLLQTVNCIIQVTYVIWIARNLNKVFD